MKRKITFLIAAIAAIMLITQPVNVNGQTKTDPVVLYSETFGSADKQVAISEHTGWSATTVMFNGSGTVASHYSGSGRIYKKDASGPSSGYTGASGNSCVVHAASTGTSTTTVITITGIKISGYTSLSMSWGMNMTNGNNTSNKTEISYKIDNGSYTALSFTHPTTSGWSLISGTISGTGSSLDIQIVLKTTAGYTTKYDDIKVTGTAAIPSDPTLTIATPTGGTIAVANATTPVSSGSTVAAGTSLTLSNEPSTGYSFSAWNVYKTGDQSTTVIVSNNSFTMPSYNTTVSATFTKNNYDVTLGTPDGVVLSASDLGEISIDEGETEAVPYGTELLLTAGSMASGKMFAWSVTKTSGGDDVTASVLSNVSADEAILTVPDYAVTVSGTVEDIIYYVTYNANGGTGTLVDPNSPYTPGDDVTVLANTFTYSGHVFKNWNTEAGGGGSDYDAGEEISDIAADVTLYAQWADAWTVTLNSNAVETITEVEKEQSISLTAPANVPSGYTYKGWTATPSNPANMVSTTYEPTANVTLYAVFAKTVQEYGESVFVLDGSNYNNGDYTYSSGTKDQALQSDPTNNFSSNSAIFIPKNGGYIYNNNAFGSEITKFEIYASNGGSSTATVGIYFSSTAFSTNPTGAYTWTSLSSGIGADAVIDVSSSIPDNTKYFYFVSTNSDKNAQVQLRITYLAPVYYTRIYPSGPVTPEDDLEIITPTVISDGTILNMGTHELSLGVGGSLTIEDGGQLICSNSVAATVKKTIADPTKAEDYGHWYTIATPVHKDATDNVVISETNLTTMGASNYDMFYFDEAQGTWINQKTSGTGFSNMYVGKGYLYRNNGTDLEITGNTNTGDIEYTLTKDGSGDIAGFNLIGNPYPHDINLKHITYSKGENLNGCYVLSDAGAWGSQLADDATISPYQGFLVQSDEDDKVATFHETAQRGAKSNGDNIKFIVANSQYEDVAYALFDKGFGLSKINHRNAAIPMLYINQEDTDYAIATMSDDTKSFNLNLKAMTTGKYTLSYKATGTYSYLHVIDRLTGEDVDMLLEGEYSFIASPIDSENRFIVRLEYSAGSEISESSIFAYQSGNDIIVNGEGELQIFDMMGRRVSTQYVSGVETINLQLNGVYIFRLNEKTQKIVVK